jgi:hypothetical protein
MGKDTKNKGNKPSYEKPQLNVIELAAEEVLATGCKMVGGPNNVGRGNCGTSGRTPCISRGS